MKRITLEYANQFIEAGSYLEHGIYVLDSGSAKRLAKQACDYIEELEAKLKKHEEPVAEFIDKQAVFEWLASVDFDLNGNRVIIIEADK